MVAELDGLEDITAVVLAGGLGTRVKTLYPDLPKPMIPVCGRPFLEWVIRYLSNQGLRQVIISTGYLSEKIEKYFESEPVEGVDIECVAEENPQGTAGAFIEVIKRRASAPKRSGWLIMNGDTILSSNLPLQAILADLKETDGVLVGVEAEDASRYGTLVIGESGRLIGFKEKMKGGGVVNAGVYFFRNTNMLNQFSNQRPLSFETEVFPKLLSQGARFRVAVSQSPFLDIGTPESLSGAESFIRENLAQLT